MANIKREKVGEKSVKKRRSFPGKKSSKQKRIGQDKKQVRKVIHFKEMRKQQQKPLASKYEKKSAGSGRETQKKSLKKNLYRGTTKEVGTLKIGKTGENGTKKVEDFFEQKLLKLKRIDQDKINAEKKLSYRERHQQKQKTIEPEILKEEAEDILKEIPSKPEPTTQEKILAEEEQKPIEPKIRRKILKDFLEEILPKLKQIDAEKNMSKKN